MKTPLDHRQLRRNEIVRAGDLVRFTALCALCPVGRNTIGRKVSELTPGPKYCRAATRAALTAAAAAITNPKP